MTDQKIDQLCGLMAILALVAFQWHNRYVISTNTLYLWVMALSVVVVILQIGKYIR